LHNIWFCSYNGSIIYIIIPMSIDVIADKIPSYADDIKLNLMEIFSDQVEGLTVQQVYGIALSCCYNLKHEQLLNNFRNEAKVILDDSQLVATKKAAAIMAMNNYYYSFSNAIKDEEIRNMPADLHMHVLTDHGVDKTDFEMYLIGVSILNHCDYCMNFHAERLLRRGVAKIAIKNIARIASVLKAVVEVLEIERLRNYEFIARESNL
jgi:alkyl hydroperoxide reductase subunit D